MVLYLYNNSTTRVRDVYIYIHIIFVIQAMLNGLLYSVVNRNNRNFYGRYVFHKTNIRPSYVFLYIS